MLTQTHADCFIFGNVNEDRAFQLSALVEDRLDKAKTGNLSKSAMVFILASMTMRERMLPEGEIVRIFILFSVLEYWNKNLSFFQL